MTIPVPMAEPQKPVLFGNRAPGRSKFYRADDIPGGLGINHGGGLPAVNTGVGGQHVDPDRVPINITADILIKFVEYIVALVCQFVIGNSKNIISTF